MRCDTLNLADPIPHNAEEHHVIGQSQNFLEDLTKFMQTNMGDPAVEVSPYTLMFGHLIHCYVLSQAFHFEAKGTYSSCHDRDIPSQPSHVYSCLLAVQTPPEQSLTKPEPSPGRPEPSTACPNPAAAFPKGCGTDDCLVSIPEAVNTIPEHI